MSSPTYYKYSLTSLHNPFFLLLLHVLIFISSKAMTETLAKLQKPPVNSSVSAVFIFGDSTSDPGNNNYITTPFKSNFSPYGRDFANKIPTGRFTNGLLSNDFVARYVGVKEYVPPYLDPTLTIEELMTGVSFASAGSGFDPLTASISNVISLSKQLENFKEYKKRIEVAIGKKRSQKLVRDALFLVSAGTNDFVINYFTLPMRSKSYSLPSYMEFVLKQEIHFMEGLWEEGARRIGVVGLPPMGCLPIVITLFSDNPILRRGCLDFYSSVALEYNIILQSQLNAMQLSLAKFGARIAYMDVYDPLTKMTTAHDNYDFEEVRIGCCGSGLLETSFICNPMTIVCSDASKYMYWDSIHPTEKTYYLLFQTTRSTIDSIIQD